ncbi:SRPBCC family protein [Lapillicoccus jejuensis]|uniref:Uncharacterized protein YndB with AHSA1/START domain n=1 Tax=Lapillicoccus jejuensis TaxID=402171 RepID=A0A542E392_9MICO|nr:SRPBCC domain-containing protein [Lapillicoccus jejuensis]TQJ09704.1 uncharacterized protein YndB with AHSA1/START domain [Lapillicoccus jejuensis]
MTTTRRSPADLSAAVAGTTREVVRLGVRSGLRVSRTYPTDVADLWSCWTDPARLVRWLGRPEGDRREGAELRLVMGAAAQQPPDADATTGFARLRVVHCDPPHRLTVRWAWEDEEPSLVDLRLRPVDADPERTELVLEHLVLDEPAARGYGAGWEDLLLRLDAAVIGSDPGFADLEAALAPHWQDEATPYPLPEVTGGDGEPATLCTRRWVAASPGAVWECVSSGPALERWYATTAQVDPRVGGTFRCTFDQGAATGEVRRCAAPYELAVSWRWDGTGTASLMTLTLEPQQRDGRPGTLVTWREEGVTGNAVGYAAGLHAHLAGLARAATGLTSRDTRWYADFVLAHSALRGRYADPFAS